MNAPAAALKQKPGFFEKKEQSEKSQIAKFTIKQVKASEIFGIADPILNFDVPVFDWDGQNVHIPAIDQAYEFRADYLAPLLWALRDNKKAWLSGHTGSGKSTLVEQTCARLGWPVLRVNFDSEITRMDLIGRDVLKSENGSTVSKFIDGILPQALSGPYVLLCDEVDFIRPDVAYAFQRALEDQGLLITEDGGRIVKSHIMSRIIATGNTQGQGDDFGIYQGARAQSLAFLDRFTVWISCGYLSKDQETRLLKVRVPNLSEDRTEEIINYVTEHREAFSSSRILQPLSPRGIQAFAQAIKLFDELGDETALKRAATYTLLNKANSGDATIISGILDRIEKKNSAEIKKKEQEQQERDKAKNKKEADAATIIIAASINNSTPIGYQFTYEKKVFDAIPQNHPLRDRFILQNHPQSIAHYLGTLVK